MSEQDEALRLADVLEALNGAKKLLPCVGGQTLGTEVYRIRLSGSDAGELLDAAAKLRRLHAENAELVKSRDGAYTERNLLVALLSTLFPSGKAKTAIEGWDESWHGCVYIDFPWGQASWHFHDSEAHLFAHLPPYQGQWDGHTTEQKYASIRAAIDKATEVKP